jgi:5-methyltetrahydrofolate--homocysteine methyltransferase
MNSPLLEAMAERVLVYDGAMGTQLQAAGLTDEDFSLRPGTGLPPLANAAAERLGGKPLDGCNEILLLTRPEVVEEVHTRYFEAGSDLVETNTFGTTSIVLAEYDVPELVGELARAAARVARRAADRFTDRKRFVVGALGPGTKLVSLGQTTFDEVEATYLDAFTGLLEERVDALLLETMQDLLLVKAGVVAAERAMAETGIRVPLFVQVTMEQTGTMLLGTEMAAALNMLECFPSVKAIGLNCATGPVEMTPHIRFLGQNSTRPLAIQPNAGLPVMERGQARYKLSAEELAEHHTRFVEEHGAALVGGCCGTTPDHIRAVAEAVGGRPHTADSHWRKVQGLFPGFDFKITPENKDGLSLIGCSSLYAFQPYRQEASYLVVGEKTNANGSKAFKEMLAADNWEGLTELAREQEAEGSHVLDVCAAYVGRDETRDMKELLSRYNRHVTVPIMIDSTETPVMEASLRCLAGKPLLNSINFEDGEGRPRKVLDLARRYGAGVVALTIDETGMAKTVERKVQIAERLIDLAREYGLPDHDLFLDCLTFTLGSGEEEFRESAMATLGAITEIKRLYPSVNTILGLSNVSFGLRPAARQVLNSAFLQFAREAGLTSAIVHASKIVPENRVDPEIWKIATDLVFDRREYATV